MTLFTPAKALLMCFIMSILLVSCQQGEKKTGDSTSTASTQDIGDTTPTIFLDSLTTSADTLLKYSNKNFVFEYFFDQTAVTLKGWVQKKSKSDSTFYDPAPNVSMVPVGKTSVSIGPNTYVGNQLLSKEVLKRIANLIKQRPAKLHFAPKRVPNTERIYYKIYIDFINKEPGEGLLSDPDFSTNPSPPHGSN